MRLPEGRPKVRIGSAIISKGRNYRPFIPGLNKPKGVSAVSRQLPVFLGLLPGPVWKFGLVFKLLPSSRPDPHDLENPDVANQGERGGKNCTTHGKRQADIDEVVPLENFRKMEILLREWGCKMVRVAQDPKSHLKLVTKDKRPDREKEVVQRDADH